MGAKTSKDVSSDQLEKTDSLRKSSSSRKSKKLDQLEAKSQIVNNLKSEIDIFAGNRQSARYSEFHEILTSLSKDFQQLKSKVTKQDALDRCDETLGEIQNCFQRLETRVNFNEQNDKNLDLAAIESHSFINQTFKQQKSPPPPALLNPNWSQELPKPTKQQQPKFNFSDTLERLQQESENLEKEIRKSIDMQDFKQFKVLEKKIEILYTDLEMINVNGYTPLNERKSQIGKRLIKLNNQIQKSKRRPAKQNATPKNEFAQIYQKLADLEIQVLTFDGTQDDKRYKEVKYTLEKYLATINSLDGLNDSENQKLNETENRIKNILQELNSRVKENENQSAAIRNMHKIEVETQRLKKMTEEFMGTTQDQQYLELDQDLRALWAQLSEIEDLNENVRRNKARVINEIQYVLKTLSNESRARENVIKVILPKDDKTNEDILQSQLFNQVKEFRNHWEQLNFNLGVDKITNPSILNSICEIFRSIVKGLNQKTHALETSNKQRSAEDVNASINLEAKNQSIAVVAKPTKLPIHTTPDLIQKENMMAESYQPLKIEIKVQPSVKTIGEMQRIGTEVKCLLQQIQESNFVQNDSNYKIFHTKLEQCKTDLENVEYRKKSDTIESNRRRVIKLINDCSRALEEKTSKKNNEEERVKAERSSKAYEIMDIDAEIQFLRQQIKNFNGVSKDKQYEKIKLGLSECLNKLQIIDNINLNKQESIQRIQQYHQEIETKLAENQAKLRIKEQSTEAKRLISQDMKILIEQVQKLKSQVERFSGAYNGLQYQQIQEEFKKVSQKLDSIDSKDDERIQNAVMQTQQKIKKYLKMLDEKSTKTQIETKPEDPRRNSKELRKSLNLDSPHHKINTLRDKLITFKDKAESFTGKYKDQEYMNIEMGMLNCYEELKHIEDKGHKSIIISKQQYEDYIKKLMQYFENKSMEEKKEEIDLHNLLDPFEELNTIETKITKFKENVDHFDGTSRDNAYKELHATSISLTKELDKVQAGNVAHVREKKRRLMEELDVFTKGLEDKANYRFEVEEAEQRRQMIKVEEIMEKIREISNAVSYFKGVKNDENYCYLDESLIRLMIQLDDLGSSRFTEVKDARKNAIQLIQKNINILTSKVAVHETDMTH